MPLSKSQYQALWDQFKENIGNSTPVDVSETTDQKRERIKKLEKLPEAWFKYYFPDFATAEPAAFHKTATRRIMDNPEWYEIRCWSRELAKSTRSMMEDLYLLLTKKKKYKILVSCTYDSAELLMLPYKVNLESNQRIINDYGKQEKIGSWETGDITTKTDFKIKAFGAGQKPRGTRKNSVRPDIIEFDDFDTDELCQNAELVEKAWLWANKAVIGTRSISKPTLIRWNGNMIAEDCCIIRAQAFANHVDIINIRDKAGNSSWPEKNSEADIKRVLEIQPISTQESEYFNNPYTVGKVFKEITYGSVPALSKFQFLVTYADPATSNKDKDKGMGKRSFKAVILIGCLNQVFYVIKCFVDQMNNNDFVDCFYALETYVEEQCKGKYKPQLYSYIENNTLQEPFFDQVFKPLFFTKSQQYRRLISIIGDDRKKPDKFVRIEGTLEPLNRLGFLIFNMKEKESPHMIRLESQMKSVNPKSTTMDGPDALEGGVFVTKTKIFNQGGIDLFTRPTNPKRF